METHLSSPARLEAAADPSLAREKLLDSDVFVELHSQLYQYLNNLFVVLLCSQNARSPDFLHKAGEYKHGCYFIFRSANGYQRQGRKCILVGCETEIFPDKLLCDLIHNPRDHGYFIWHTSIERRCLL